MERRNKALPACRTDSGSLPGFWLIRGGNPTQSGPYRVPGSALCGRLCPCKRVVAKGVCRSPCRGAGPDCARGLRQVVEAPGDDLLLYRRAVPRRAGQNEGGCPGGSEKAEASEKAEGDCHGGIGKTERARSVAVRATRFSHGPYAANECYQCHEISASGGFRGFGKQEEAAGSLAKAGIVPGKMVAPWNELCVGCHTSKKPEKAYPNRPLGPRTGQQWLLHRVPRSTRLPGAIPATEKTG